MTWSAITNGNTCVWMQVSSSLTTASSNSPTYINGVNFLGPRVGDVWAKLGDSMTIWLTSTIIEGGP